MADIISDVNALEDFWRTGHFWNPRYPETHNVKTLREARAIGRLQHPIARWATMSFQQADSSLDMLAIDHHQRTAVADGDAGPATKELLRARLDRAFLPHLRGCPVPDHKPPDGVLFGEDDADLAAVAESMAGFEDGPYPRGCLEGHEDAHAIRVDVIDSNMPRHWRDNWGWLVQKSRELWADIGVRMIYLPRGSRSEIDMSWRNGRGWIGLAQALGQSCGGRGFLYLDPGYNPRDRWRLLTLLQHEEGHSCNKGHTRGGIMNPTILRTDGNWRTDPSWPTFQLWYGGERVPIDPAGGPDPEPTPPPGGTPSGWTHAGVFVIEEQIYEWCYRKAR